MTGHLQEHSEYTSASGSYSCPSNEDKTVDLGDGKEKSYNVYPNVMMVMRHTERLDDFFPDWIARNRGKYRPHDLNMPMTLPVQRSVECYQDDPPITNTGDILARIIARGMLTAAYSPVPSIVKLTAFVNPCAFIPGAVVARSKVPEDFEGLLRDLIYSSPALRCIQTANAMRSILGCESKIRVEPGLFENLSLYPKGLPNLATPEQRSCFNTDEEYEPYLTIGELAKSSETTEDYNMRLKNTLLRIAKLHDVSNVKRDQIVLLIAHASTVDLAAGHLARLRSSTVDDLDKCFRKIPTGSVLVLEKVQGRRGWTPNLYALPKMTYSHQSTTFDPGFVLREPMAVKNKIEDLHCEYA